MARKTAQKREEARRLYLTGEVSTNKEIAQRIKVKPHTVARWKGEEDWDSLRSKIDIRAADLFVEKIANDRVTLNVRHYRIWELLVAKLADGLKTGDPLEIRDLERLAAILDRAQKGQRLAKGLSATGETEEAIRAKSVADQRRIVDVFVDTVKENVHDEEARDRIRRAIVAALPAEESPGAGEPGH